jgi:hypothetical protein
MARRRDGFQRPSGANDAFSIRNGEIGLERQIGTGLEPLIFPEMQRSRGAMRAFRHDGRAGRRLDSSRGRGMVAMRMSHEHVRHRFAAHRVEKSRYVRLVFGPWIEDGDPAAPDDVAHGAFVGERARIIGEQPPQARHDLFDLTRREVEAPVEGNILGHPSQNSAGDPLDRSMVCLLPSRFPARLRGAPRSRSQAALLRSRTARLLD